MADHGVLAWISVVLLACFSAARGNQHAKGWGDEINWVSFEDGLTQAKEQNKPLMLVIHKSWCGACKALKPKFASSKEIAELSKDFILVNTEDEEEPTGDQYRPDGGYIPRILFLDNEGKVRKEYINADGNASYKYYYPSTDDIVTSMTKVLADFKKGVFSSDKKKTEL